MTKEEKKEAKKLEYKQLHEFMYNWWLSFGKYKRCMACGKLLPSSYSSANVDHLLGDRKYPQYMFNTNNLFLVCLSDHDLKESGFPKKKHLEAMKKVLSLHLNGEL